MGRIERASVTLFRWFLTGMLALAPAAAYYHYNRYNASYQPVPEKFDLTALPNGTLTFFVSDSGPVQFQANDSFPSVLGQIRQATQVWNAVDNSDLRVSFGGLYTAGTTQSAPAGLVVFEEMEPGTLALSSHTTATGMTIGAGGTFLPITQGMVKLNRNLTGRLSASYLESFFTIVVHEMGHAVGLQHTFTSAAMSTSVTRATSRTRPLEADDIAGLSLLYPRAGTAASFGSIAGRVSWSGQGVHLASVVALRPNGSAVSTLTRPDGTYVIERLPPDNYWVYVQPLPSNPDIRWPIDANGQEMTPTGPFETQFYPGTREPSQFISLPVIAGTLRAGIDFSVQRRSALALSDMYTYGWDGQGFLSPAFINSNNSAAGLVVGGNGLVAGDKIVEGLNVRFLGGPADLTAKAVLAWDGRLIVYFDYPPLPGTGPRHMLVTQGDDAWVLPSALNLTQTAPPSIKGVMPNADGAVAISGTGLNSDSRIYFDGLPATVRIPFSGSDQLGTVVVAPPPGAPFQIATLTAFNSDGQNSMFVQQQNPPVYDYGPADHPVILVSPGTLPAGTSAMVEVTGVNTRFTEGLTTLGLGSSDILVRRVWVLSPTRLIANVTVSGAVAVSVPMQASVISGFQVAVQPFAFVAQAPNMRLPMIGLPLANANRSQSAIYPGATVSMYGLNLSVSPGSASITLNDQPAPILFASAGQINFTVPPSTPIGPAILRLHTGSDSAFPIVLQVDPVQSAQ